jgi:hypothetical protein
MLSCSIPASAQAQDTVSVFLLDDQTGEELATKHGIHALVTSDLEALINAVLKGTTPVRLLHQAVDEDATDSPIVEMDFRPYSGSRPPLPPSPNLPIRQLAEEMKNYQQARVQWQRGILVYRDGLIGEVQNFVRGVMTTQAAVARHFDELLAERNGRDFDRSDIVGSLSAANHALGSEGRRYLVLNTDAVDLPGKRKPRRTPLTTDEFSPDIDLIWVNTSRIPDGCVLFSKAPNRTHHANSMKEAMELIAAALVQTNNGGSQRDDSDLTPNLPPGAGGVTLGTPGVTQDQ